MSCAVRRIMQSHYITVLSQNQALMCIKLSSLSGVLYRFIREPVDPDGANRADDPSNRRMLMQFEWSAGEIMP
jgi:hypothetical protein